MTPFRTILFPARPLGQIWPIHLSAYVVPPIGPPPPHVPPVRGGAVQLDGMSAVFAGSETNQNNRYAPDAVQLDGMSTVFVSNETAVPNRFASDAIQLDGMAVVVITNETYP